MLIWFQIHWGFFQWLINKTNNNILKSLGRPAKKTWQFLMQLIWCCNAAALISKAISMQKASVLKNPWHQQLQQQQRQYFNPHIHTPTGTCNLPVTVQLFTLISFHGNIKLTFVFKRWKADDSPGLKSKILSFVVRSRWRATGINFTPMTRTHTKKK